MKLKRRVSLKPTTRNKNGKGQHRQQQQQQPVNVNPTPTDQVQHKEERHGHNGWQWVNSALLNWDFGSMGRAQDSARDAAPIEAAGREGTARTPSQGTTELQKKQKFRPMIAALKQKLKRKPRPLLNLEEEEEDCDNGIVGRTDPALTHQDYTRKEENSRQPLLTYEQWEGFMDTVAFPEKSRPYLALKDYIASSRQASAAETSASEEPVQENDSESEGGNFSMSHGAGTLKKKLTWEEYLSTQSVDEESVKEMKATGITWEEFMDTVAFPEKILARKYESLLTFIAQNRVGKDDDGAQAIESESRAVPEVKMVKDKYAFEEEEEIDFGDHVTLFSIQRDSLEEHHGISLTVVNDEEGIFVSHVACDSKAFASGLRPGMQIISINQESCPEDLEEAQFLLDNLDDPEIQIFAQPGVTPAIVVQGMGTLGNGISAISNFYNANVARVFAVEENGSDQSTEEGSNEDQDGDKDDDDDDDDEWEKHPKQSNGVLFKLRKKCQTATIDTNKPRRARRGGGTNSTKIPPMSLKKFSIHKESRREVIGVAFVQTEDWPGIFVDQVMPSSKFYRSGLSKGMRLVWINGQPSPTNIDAVIQRIQTITGPLELSVEVEPHHDNFNNNNDNVGKTLDYHNHHCDAFLTATIMKRAGDAAGVNLRRDLFRSGIYIQSIDPSSDFVGTNLRSGLRVLSINGMKCPRTVRDCLRLMDQADGRLDIIAETVAVQRLRLDR